VADPGFEGGGGRKQMKVLTIEVKLFLASLGHISIKMMLKMNRERSERRKKKELRKFDVWGIKNHRSAAAS